MEEAARNLSKGGRGAEEGSDLKAAMPISYRMPTVVPRQFKTTEAAR